MTPPPKFRILIVEDEQIVALDLRTHLEKSGYEVIAVVNTAADAVRAAELQSPDVVLMDIQLMGEADGIEAASRIRSNWSIPVVFLTANTNVDTVAKANASEPFGYLVKPFRAPELDATLRLALQHRYKEIREAEEKRRLEQEFHATSEVLGHTQAELRALSAHLLTAQEEERKRVARELHDDLGQRAAVVGMHVGLALESLYTHPEEARRQLLALRDETAALEKTLRDVSHRLHPSILEDIGLVAALEALMEDFESVIKPLYVGPERIPHLSIDKATVLYRIAQESLRNAMKHAPGCDVRVSLECSKENVQLTIQDNGPGFDLSKIREKGGLGLLAMQERARLVGGMFLFRASPGGGTTVSVRVPFDGFGNESRVVPSQELLQT